MSVIVPVLKAVFDVLGSAIFAGTESSLFCDKDIYIYYRSVGLRRILSSSRRLWESPPTPTERYERRVRLCRIHCT